MIGERNRSLRAHVQARTVSVSPEDPGGEFPPRCRRGEHLGDPRTESLIDVRSRGAPWPPVAGRLLPRGGWWGHLSGVCGELEWAAGVGRDGNKKGALALSVVGGSSNPCDLDFRAVRFGLTQTCTSRTQLSQLSDNTFVSYAISLLRVLRREQHDATGGRGIPGWRCGGIRGAGERRRAGAGHGR
jgi:hypothetical protein